MDWSFFPIYLGSCAAAAMTGAWFAPDSWYRELAKPRWTPPDWVFPVVWTTVYILIAVAAARVAGKPGSAYALALWAMQMPINALWSPVFFGLRRIGQALAVIGALWVSVAACMVALWQVDMIAGLLFLPYLTWLTIAAALNYSIWRTNPVSAAPGSAA
jgi:tryptophan-rich sensory protein